MPSFMKPFKVHENEGHFEKLRHPMACTPKLDGIRGGKKRETPYLLSNSFKPIQNKYINSCLSAILSPDALLSDGEIHLPPNEFELAAGKPYADFQRISSAVMKQSGTPDFNFALFDFIPDDERMPYLERTQQLHEWWKNQPVNRQRLITPIMPEMIYSLEEMLDFERRYIDLGYEGIIMRDPNGPYKWNRSSLKEGWLLALKRFTDSEAVITGFFELNHNANESYTNELGRTKRSTAKDGMVGMDTLGGVYVSDLYNPEFSNMKIGGGKGLSAELRKWIWEHQDECMNCVVKYRYFGFGMKTLPRNPQWNDWRDLNDLDVPTQLRILPELKNRVRSFNATVDLSTVKSLPIENVSDEEIAADEPTLFDL